MIKRDYLPKIIIRREDASRKTMEMKYRNPSLRHGLRCSTDFMLKIRYIRCRILYCYWLLPLTDLLQSYLILRGAYKIIDSFFRVWIQGRVYVPYQWNTKTPIPRLSEFMLNERASTWKGEKRLQNLFSSYLDTDFFFNRIEPSAFFWILYTNLHPIMF
jgi:hypothetical protein